MDTEQINLAAFMAETLDLGQLDTKIDPIPDGEYTAVIGTGEKDVELAAGVSKGATPRAWLRLDLMMDIQDENLKVQLKRDNVRIRHSIMLDLNDAGKLDTRPQRNVQLGKLRDAVNQNRPGAWGFPMLKGQALKIKTKQDPAKDGTDTIYNRVVSVTRAI